MGKSSIAVKQWLRDKRRFADLFNGTVFQGQQIVLPEELEERDCESSIIVTDKENNEKGVQKYRDITMLWKQKTELAVLACENQNKVHYAMPVRMMIYDGLSYADQMRKIWKSREQEEKVTQEEFLSQFRKEDKIYPVISLVFYYGLTPWDASRDLYGMFDQEDKIRNHDFLKQYIQNYKINLIDAGNVEEVEKFQSDLQQIFGVLKYRGQGSGMQEYMEKHKDYFSKVDLETYQAVREMLHSETQLKSMLLENKEAGIDMCKAIEEIYNNGLNEGIEQGKTDVLLQMVQKKLSKGMSAEEIADVLEQDVNTIKKLIQLLA